MKRSTELLNCWACQSGIAHDGRLVHGPFDRRDYVCDRAFKAVFVLGLRRHGGVSASCH